MGNCICNRPVLTKTAIIIDELNNEKVTQDNGYQSNRDKKNIRGLNPQQGSVKAVKIKESHSYLIYSY
jgi:hypothetical protein